MLKGSQKNSALQLKGWFKSKTSIQEHRNEIQNSYQTCAWIIWYIFPIQCEKLRTNHLTLLHVVTVPYACWFLWRAYYIEDFKWHLHFQFGVAFWRVVLREVYFEGPNRVWRALTFSRIPSGLKLTYMPTKVSKCPTTFITCFLFHNGHNLVNVPCLIKRKAETLKLRSNLCYY